MRFYKCPKCGSIVEKLNDQGCTPACCGSAMQELIAGTSDGAAEKHVPVVSVDGDKVSVKVGEVAHPMADVHYIEWIALETKKGSQRHILQPGDTPETAFVLPQGDMLVAAYAYCNLHGLWKSAQ